MHRIFIIAARERPDVESAFYSAVRVSKPVRLGCCDCTANPCRRRGDESSSCRLQNRQQRSLSQSQLGLFPVLSAKVTLPVVNKSFFSYIKCC